MILVEASGQSRALDRHTLSLVFAALSPRSGFFSCDGVACSRTGDPLLLQREILDADERSSGGNPRRLAGIDLFYDPAVRRNQGQGADRNGRESASDGDPAGEEQQDE